MYKRKKYKYLLNSVELILNEKCQIRFDKKSGLLLICSKQNI